MRLSKIRNMIHTSKVQAENATCNRLHVGAVIFDDEGAIISTGYNGAPRGMPHCDDVGHLMVDGHCLRTIHAETNACLFAGTRARRASMASEYRPCLVCANVIIQVGIKAYYYQAAYHNDRNENDVVGTLLAQGGVELIHVGESDEF